MDKYIIIMKVGPFCGYSLEEIIDIKRAEEEKVGRFYFGYAGVFCHPSKVVRFLDHAKKNGVQKVKLLFITTPSDFESQVPRSKSFSVNGVDWEPLSDDVLLVGSKYAFVGKNIANVNYDLDLSQYRTMLGKQRGKFLNEQLKFRADKSCAILEPRESPPKMVTIKYESELVYPFCVMVK